MNLKSFQSPRIRQAWEYRSDPEAVRVLAAFFWRTLLLVALVAIVCALWFGYQEIGAASQAESVGTVAPTPKAPFDPSQLQTALNAFSAKATEYQVLSQSPPPTVADPSK